MNTLLYIYPTLFGLSIEVYFILIVLGIPTFFIWRWLFKIIIKVERTRKIATWTATFITTPLIYTGVIFLWIFCITYYPTYQFTQKKWISDKEKRYEVSQDLIRSKMLIGKTKAEVQILLGIEGNFENSDDWTYDIGYVPGLFNIDPFILTITFKDGKVIQVEQHES